MSRVLLDSHVHPTIPRLRLDRRNDSPFYQARTFINGRQFAHFTKTADIRAAFRVAESWYKQHLRAKPDPLDTLGLDPTVGDVQRAYLDTLDQKRKAEAQKRWGPIKAFWATIRLVEIGPKTFRAFYTWRRRTTKGITPHSLHKDSLARHLPPICPTRPSPRDWADPPQRGSHQLPVRTEAEASSGGVGGCGATRSGVLLRRDSPSGGKGKHQPFRDVEFPTRHDSLALSSRLRSQLPPQSGEVHFAPRLRDLSIVKPVDDNAGEANGLSCRRYAKKLA